VVGPPPLPHSCPSPTLTLGARPPGGLMAHVTNLCHRSPEREWKELSKEAVAERRPGARALPPRAFHRATQNAAAARRRRASKQPKKGTPPKPYATSSQPPWPLQETTPSPPSDAAPPLGPLPLGFEDYSPPPSLPIPVPTAAALRGAIRTAPEGHLWGPLALTWDLLGCSPETTTTRWRRLPPW